METEEHDRFPYHISPKDTGPFDNHAVPKDLKKEISDLAQRSCMAKTPVRSVFLHKDSLLQDRFHFPSGASFCQHQYAFR